MSSQHTVVIGAGIFGVTAALELNARGHRVSLFDPGPLPHPLAASTDISKVIRMEYGPDEGYMALVEEAREGWLAWNEEWMAAGSEPLYHETGVLITSREPMAEGGFEYESWRMLLQRGHTPERMDTDTISQRYPAWSTGRYIDGFFHSKGGYAESGRVVEALARTAEREGVTLHADRKVAGLLEKDGRVVGLRDDKGGEVRADEIVLAAGAWTGKMVPHLARCIRATGHPVFHLKPKARDDFASERFPVFTADVARTGYYGFPVNRDGIVKIANHGVGTPIDPDAPRAVSERDENKLHEFLEETFPSLADAPVVFTRLCLYADTQDEDFWIARDPERKGLTVASGGSGHGFKFAPVLGRLVADAVEGKGNEWLETFRWRPDLALERGREAARDHGG